MVNPTNNTDISHRLGKFLKIERSFFAYKNFKTLSILRLTHLKRFLGCLNLLKSSQNL